MKISHLFETLEKSQTYKDFSKAEETKDAFLCAAFLIMNFKQNLSDYSLDFRDEKQIFTFKIPSDKKAEVSMLKEGLIQERKPFEKIKEEQLKKIKVDMEDLQNLVQKEMDKLKISNRLDEIIAVLQSSDEQKKLVWSMTCMCDGFAIISSIIDAISGEVIKFEKKNLLDFISVRKNDAKK